jgi:hypothetical protein
LREMRLAGPQPPAQEPPKKKAPAPDYSTVEQWAADRALERQARENAEKAPATRCRYPGAGGTEAGTEARDKPRALARFG